MTLRSRLSSRTRETSDSTDFDSFRTYNDSSDVSRQLLPSLSLDHNLGNSAFDQPTTEATQASTVLSTQQTYSNRLELSILRQSVLDNAARCVVKIEFD